MHLSAPDISVPEPSIVFVLSGYFANTHERLDHVYCKRGVTYAITVSRGADPMGPPAATIYRYDGLRERDVQVADVGAVAEQYVAIEEVGTIDGTGCEVWWDSEAEHDVPGLRAQ